MGERQPDSNDNRNSYLESSGAGAAVQVNQSLPPIRFEEPSAPPPDDTVATEGSGLTDEFMDVEEFEFYSNVPSRVNSVEDFDLYDDVGPQTLKTAPLYGEDGKVYPKGEEAELSEYQAAAAAARARQRAREKKVEAEKTKKKLTGETGGKDGKLRRDPNIPRALYDPKVRKQLAKMRQHHAFFIYTVMAMQIILVLCSMAVNWKAYGLPVQTSPFNLMVGPQSSVIIQMGARYTGCLRSQANANKTGLYCPSGVSGKLSGNWCTTSQLEDFCGMTSFYTGDPDQWYRFLTATFIHGGVVHVAFTALLQWRTAVSMEEDFGWWRIGLVYLFSATGGFIFGAVFNPTVTATGSTPAIYGLIGCQVLDLIQNWTVIVRPWREMFKLVVTMILAFAAGLLPYIDNFANLGGFLTGFCTGFVLMPSIHVSKFSKRRKQVMIGLAIPAIILLYVLGLRAFYLKSVSCTYCAYFDCFPAISGFCGISQSVAH